MGYYLSRSIEPIDYSSLRIKWTYISNYMVIWNLYRKTHTHMHTHTNSKKISRFWFYGVPDVVAICFQNTSNLLYLSCFSEYGKSLKLKLSKKNVAKSGLDFYVTWINSQSVIHDCFSLFQINRKQVHWLKYRQT